MKCSVMSILGMANLKGKISLGFFPVSGITAAGLT